jgi:hypothetical protein
MEATCGFCNNTFQMSGGLKENDLTYATNYQLFETACDIFGGKRVSLKHYLLFTGS